MRVVYSIAGHTEREERIRMKEKSGLRQVYWLVVLLLLHGSLGWTQTTHLASFPTGLKPLGVAVNYLTVNQPFAAVANSGDNSVSIFQVNTTPKTASLNLVATVTGIPSPYGVFPCGGGSTGNTPTFLVTSPSDNSVRLISAPQGQIVGTVKTGSQPYTAACFATGAVVPTAAVSNWGDSTLTLFNSSTLQMLQTIQGVPGARSFHGLDELTNQVGATFVAVAGTDANLVTEVINQTRIQQTPVTKPISVFVYNLAGNIEIASEAGTGLVISGGPSTTFPNVPNPSDVVLTGSGFQTVIATLGDSLWADVSGNVSLIPGIPGASAIATFNLAPASPSGPGNEALLVTSTNSNSIFLLYLPTSPPTSQFAAQSAASAQPATPGSIASAFIAATGVSQAASAGSFPLPTTLGALTLSMGGTWNFDWTSGQWSYSPAGATEAALFYVGPTQINFQIPPGVAPGAVLAQIQEPNGTVLVGTINVVATSPTIFTVSENGQGQAAALNEDYSPNSVSNPAARGSVLQLFLTGAGATNPPLLPGQPADPSGNPLVLTQVQPTVTISGQPAQVLFSGMAPGFAGLWQIDVVVPEAAGVGPPVPLVVTAGGVSSNLVTVALK